MLATGRDGHTHMLRVTWDWLGPDRALDLANTIAVVEGDERDLIPDVVQYERWVDAEASTLELGDDEVAALVAARSRLLRLRPAVRAVIAAAAAGRRLPRRAIGELNEASRIVPEWLELHPTTRRLRRGGRGGADVRVVAAYARAAMGLIAEDAVREIRVCPAPSCGMFFLPGRSDQHWCSQQCGARARVARYYRAHKRERDGGRRTVPPRRARDGRPRPRRRESS